jgi:hypothetical protein
VHKLQPSAVKSAKSAKCIRGKLLSSPVAQTFSILLCSLNLNISCQPLRSFLTLLSSPLLRARCSGFLIDFFPLVLSPARRPFFPIHEDHSFALDKFPKMKYCSTILLAAFAASDVLAHGVVTEVQGANGVSLPGLSLIDGTPRDCATPACGAEADTSIIRQNELGTSQASALGKTNGGGPVDAAKMISLFMDGAGGNSTEAVAARAAHAANLAARDLVERQTGGGTRTPQGTKETAVKAATGAAAASGLPTTADDGTLTMTFHQVNQDGAGPLTADVDGTSGGTDPSAFKTATVTQNVPGIGIGGLSGAAVMDFPIAIQMPQGMTCSGSSGGASNVCVARLQNSALAGPFGGSVAFTQSAAAKKRAIEYNLAKRRFARGLKTTTDDE